MRKNTISQNFVYNWINTIATIVIGLAISIIIARFLGPSNYGIYSNVIWILGVISIIALMGLPYTTQKYVSEYDGRQDQDNVKKIIGFILKIEVLWGVIIAVLLIVLADKLSLWLNHPKNLFWIMGLILVPDSCIAIFTSVVKGLQIFKSIMWINVIAKLLSLSLIFIVLKKGGGVAGILWVHLIVCICVIGLYWVLLKDVLFMPASVSLARTVRKKLLGFNFTILAIGATEQVIRQKSGVFFLNLFRAPVEAGYYSLAFGIAIMAVQFLPESLVNVVASAMSNRYGAQDKAGLNQIFTKSIRYVTLMIVPICTSIIVMAKPLVGLVYGERYLASVNILPVLIIASGLGGIAHVAVWLIYAIEKQNINLAIGILAMILNLILAILLIPNHGIYGAAIVNLAAQSIGFLLTFLWIQKTVKFKFPLSSFLKTCLAGIIAGRIMYFFVDLCGKNLPGLAGLLILGMGIYMVIVFMTQRAEIKELKGYFLNLLKKDLK